MNNDDIQKGENGKKKNLEKGLDLVFSMFITAEEDEEVILEKTKQRLHRFYYKLKIYFKKENFKRKFFFLKSNGDHIRVLERVTVEV